MPSAYWRWHMAEKFGWSLEYIDALSMADFAEYLSIADGKAKAR